MTLPAVRDLRTAVPPAGGGAGLRVRTSLLDMADLATLPAQLAVGETVILLHPPLPSAGVSMRTERGRQQNDSTLANG